MLSKLRDSLVFLCLALRTRRSAITLLSAVAVWCLLWFGFANPFNFFVPQSVRFSLSRFQTIEPGTSVADAVKLLGEPIKVVKEDRFDPSCPTCIDYCFMGEPPNWVVGFKEAWLIADQQGRVVRVFVNTEP